MAANRTRNGAIGSDFHADTCEANLEVELLGEPTVERPKEPRNQGDRPEGEDFFRASRRIRIGGTEPPEIILEEVAPTRESRMRTHARGSRSAGATRRRGGVACCEP